MGYFPIKFKNAIMILIPKPGKDPKLYTSLIVLSVGFVLYLQNLTFVNSQYWKAVFGNSLAPSSSAPKFMQPLCLKLENELE